LNWKKKKTQVKEGSKFGNQIKKLMEGLLFS
jgi:hypothetical protein